MTAVRSFLAKPLVYLTLIGVTALSAFPLYFSGVVASQDNSALATVPPPLVFGGNLLSNIQRVRDTVPFDTALMDSFIISIAVTFSVVFFSTLAGFAFSKLRFRGKTVLLLGIVATMTVPPQLGAVPLYIIMVKLQLLDTLPAIILPALVNAFGVFFMTQYLREALPTELLEAGRMDGCSSFGLFWHVVLPVARPAAAVLAMLTFLATWNDYFWPNLVAGDKTPTVQTILSTLRSGYVQDYSLSLTGTLMGTLPLVVVFALLGRQIIGGIMQGAVKG
ncbi:MAG: cellobiose transport system permease protein [Cryptosporangiaceae bacterium]|jgi:cellobiose transport system permease protein|nr:cellobiose transport system permease protein [Cryptosporangiaceae bacterium]